MCFKNNKVISKEIHHCLGLVDEVGFMHRAFFHGLHRNVNLILVAASVNLLAAQHSTAHAVSTSTHPNATGSSLL